MVALVRAGVTATCSGADHPRYGDLAVDSNLPTRGSPWAARTRTPSPQPFSRRPTALRRELKRQLERDGSCEVLGASYRAPCEAWVPGADLRPTRALPVLVIVGRDLRRRGLLVDDLADAEISVDQNAPGGMEPFEPRTVALLNRGMPVRRRLRRHASCCR